MFYILLINCQSEFIYFKLFVSFKYTDENCLQQNDKVFKLTTLMYIKFNFYDALVLINKINNNFQIILHIY